MTRLGFTRVPGTILKTASAMLLATSCGLVAAGGAHADGLGAGGSGGSTISHNCTLSGNLSLGLPATHGACVAGTLPVNSNSAFLSSYCSNFSYPGYVYDPIAMQQIYLTSRGQCLQYSNHTYK